MCSLIKAPVRLSTNIRLPGRPGLFTTARLRDNNESINYSALPWETFDSITKGKGIDGEGFDEFSFGSGTVSEVRWCTWVHQCYRQQL